MRHCRIIVPITGRDMEQILGEVKDIASSEADIAEWRYDLKGEWKEEAFLSELQQVSETLGGKKLLFTIRTDMQGGRFPFEPSQYFRFVMGAIYSGRIQYVDLEDITPMTDRQQAISASHMNGVKVILSYHDFEKTPPAEQILRKLRSHAISSADILKVAYMPKSPKDVAALLYATAAFKEEDQEKHELITMSMGELGRISRVSGDIFGSDYTFATLGGSSAPGQPPVETVLKILDTLQ